MTENVLPFVTSPERAKRLAKLQGGETYVIPGAVDVVAVYIDGVRRDVRSTTYDPETDTTAITLWPVGTFDWAP